MHATRQSYRIEQTCLLRYATHGQTNVQLRGLFAAHQIGENASHKKISFCLNFKGLKKSVCICMAMSLKTILCLYFSL